MFFVDDDKERLEPAEDAVAAPILRQLHRGARHVRRISLQLLLELIKEPHPVGRRTGEPGEDPSASKSTHFVGVGLHHRLTDGNLSIATKRNLSIAAHGQDRRRADARENLTHDMEDTPSHYSCLSRQTE